MTTLQKRKLRDIVSILVVRENSSWMRPECGSIMYQTPAAGEKSGEMISEMYSNSKSVMLSNLTYRLAELQRWLM